MAGFRIEGDTSGNVAEVSANNGLEVHTPTTQANAGFVQISGEVDSGVVLGTRTVRAVEVSEDFRTRVGLDSLLFNLSFEGTNIARDRIQQNDTTATMAQASGFLTLNSGSSVTSGQGTNGRIYRTFPLFGSFSTYVDFWARVPNATATNSLAEWGLGYCSGVTAQLTDGVYFRVISGGTLRAVMTFNSVDTVTTDITTTNIPTRDGAGSFDITECNHYVVSVHNDTVSYWINDTLAAVNKVPANQGSPTSAMNQPMFWRVYNSGAASAAKQLGLGFISAAQGSLNANKPFGQQMTGSGGGSYQIQPGTVSGPTVTRGTGALGWPTSATARIAGTWTATSAPALNSLGGLWLSPAISTLTSDADYPVFAYQNPAGTATLPGKTLYITGISVGTTTVTTVSAVNAITLAYAAGINSTTAATNTAESATAVAMRIVPLGQVAFIVGAAVGTSQPGSYYSFSQSPLVCDPGKFVHFIVRPFGTVLTNTLVVAGSVTFIGHFA